MDKYKIIADKLHEADAILIAASNGLSITEGLNLFACNEDFYRLFGDFARKYGFRNILDGCFAQFAAEEEKWSWWSRLIWHYSGSYTGSETMKSLKRIADSKPHFIVTSNGEAHFELAGFSSENIYEIEGSWEHMQCSRACHDTLYPTRELIQSMAAAEKDGKVPTELIPHCPKCGAAMNIHLPVDGYFIPNSAAEKRFTDFVNRYHNKKLVILELGIGSHNRMIKAPLMQLVRSDPAFSYITFNKGDIYIMPQIKDRSIAADGLLADIFAELMARFDISEIE